MVHLGFQLVLILGIAQCYFGKEINDISEKHPDKRALSKCFDDLGCFSITSDFIHLARRPINLLPADRESINTKFLLYTRKNIKQFHQLKAKDAKSIDSSDFNPELDTKFIIHGYFDNQLFGEWMRTMKDEFLMHGDYNVIIVDWSGGNTLPYAQASSNTRVVGAEIALLVNYLKEKYSLKTEKVHILGHSLGAHICGYAGERIKNLGRITGMDPAEPFFQGMPPSVRIDPTDANFVDVIHSDAKSIFLLGLGMSDLVGHVDFFPDDGNDHPGCNLNESLWSIVTTGLGEGARRFVSCNHQRSVDFMTDSINNHQCYMIGVACEGWQSFLAGKCTSCGSKGEKCATVGLRSIESKEVLLAEGNPGKLYFQTADKSPFCKFHYQVAIKLTKEGKSEAGGIKVTLKGSKKDQEFLLGTPKTKYHPGDVHVFLITTQRDLGAIEGLKLHWEADYIVSIGIRKFKISLEYARVFQLSTDADGQRTNKAAFFCDKAKNPIKHKDTVTYVKKEKEHCT